MKRQYLQSLPKPTDIRNQAYKSYLNQVQQLFSQLQSKYDGVTAQLLHEQLKNLSDIRQIKKIHKKPIYEYFLKRQLSSLQYLKGIYSVSYSIMKITKCKLEDFKVDWKQIFQRISQEAPQISGSTNTKNVEIFLKHIRVFFDENNAIDVLNYFEQKNIKDIFKFLMLFVRISPQTSEQVFNKFVKMLIDRCKLQKISKTDFLSLFIWLQKNRKHISLSKQIYEFVNDLVLEYILASDKSSKKNTFENNFNSTSAEVLEKILGKANPDSIKLLQIIFSFVKKFVKPLENSTKSVMFIYWLYKAIFLRVQLQKKTRERLLKIMEKINKKKQPQQEQDDGEPETKSQTQIAIIEKAALEQADKKQKQNDNQEDDDSQDVDDEDEENQEEDLQQLLLFGQSSKVSFQKDDEDKGDTDEERKEKMQKLLSNQLTTQILACIQQQTQQLFQVLYFVNSKKTISHLLRYIYRLFPKFVVKSLDTLNKAANIPNINEDGLVKNLTVTVEHMFMPENYKDGIKNLMRVLEKAFNSRRIVDVWGIYESVSSKIPMLDEKDLEKIDDKDKQEFQKTFQINHDRFYDEYSGHMLEAFKKLLTEGEFIEKDQNSHYLVAMEQYYYNSYPNMKKRLLEEVMEVLTQKPNSLSLQYLNFADLPNRQYEILKQQFKSMNEQNRDTQQLRIQFINVLSKKMNLQQLKPYIRKMAHKGHFHLIYKFYVNNAPQRIKWNPYKTTLNYFYEDPKLTIQFQTTVQERRKFIKQLQQYRDQLINEASQQIDKMKQDEHDSVQKRVIKSYTTPAKISTQAQRKKLYEILQLISSINIMMQQKIIDIKNKKKLQLVPSFVSPYQFLNPQKPFNKRIKKLLNIQQVLHDPKIVSVLNKLLTNQYFLHFDIYAYETKNLQKQKKKNKNHESPDCANRIIYSSEYLSNAKCYMAMLLHKTHAGKNYKIDSLVQELFILSIVNTNQTYKDIRSMFQESKKIDQYRGFLFDVMKAKVQNRDLIKRISSTFDFLAKTQQYRPFTDQQVLDFVDYHSSLIQNYDLKIKELAFKSFRKFMKIIQENPISDFVNKQMLKYRNTDKMQLIWLTYAASYMTHLQFQKDKKLVQERTRQFLKHTQGLLLHESRSIRRISLFLYPFLIRTLKKLNVSFETKAYQTEKYTEKTLEQFLQTGYIRKEQENIDLKDRSVHKKHPQSEYRLKNQSQKQQNFFSFLIENEQNSLKFIKSYHSDLASTTEMLISAMQSSISTVDLFTIATKSIEKLIYINKTKSLTVSTSQFLVGSRFFKYLCIEDSKSGFKFFHAVKDFILGCLDNLESLDNQTLVILYAYNLMSAYETTFKERIPEVENFLTKIMTQIIKKSSKNIYSKLQTIFFKKIKNYESVKFITELCEKMLEQNKKVYRAGYLLAVVSGKNYSNSENLLKKMISQRVQLENQNYVNNILNFLVAFPLASVWKKEEILKTHVIDLQKLKSENKVKYFLDDYVLYQNKELLNYFVKEIREMIFSESIDLIKAGFNTLNSLIKNCASLYPDEQMSNFLTQLLKISMDLLKQKKQLQLDFESSYKSIGYLFGSEILPREVFQKYLITVLENVEPTKKFIDLLTQILNSPINYIKLSDEVADKFITKILDLESNSALYKSLLKILSTFFRYKISSFEKINQKQKENKNRRILLIQSYLLAENVHLNPQFVQEVLKLSPKDKKNMWARQMLLTRGQREYFDDEKTYQVWRQIKQLSNPYHYHA